MVKRFITALLWFMAAWTAGSMIATFTGLPWLLAPAAGFVAGGIVWWDPRGVLWKVEDRALRRRRLADLPRVAELHREAEVSREVESVKG